MRQILLKNQGLLIITHNLKNQIDYLHRKIGKTEWIGYLFYSIVDNNSDILKPENFKVRAEEVFLLSTGTETYVESPQNFEINERINKSIPLANPFNKDFKYRKGLIHTHHSMDTFFSNIDVKELEDNSDNYDYYLSLIVNFEGKYTAKVAYYVEDSGEYNLINSKGLIKSIKNRYLVTFDLHIEFENDSSLSDKFKNNYSNVIQAKKDEEENSHRNSTQLGLFDGGNYSGLRDGETFLSNSNISKDVYTFLNYVLTGSKITYNFDFNYHKKIVKELGLKYKLMNISSQKAYLESLKERIEYGFTLASCLSSKDKDLLIQSVEVDFISKIIDIDSSAFLDDVYEAILDFIYEEQ